MSSFVVATPDAFAAASENLTGIGSAIRQAHAAAAGLDGNIIAGLDSTGTSADVPTANNATATGGSGGNGSSGQTGFNGTEGDVFAVNSQNSDGQTGTGTNGANNP
jgi:hypothetical protein